MPSIHFQRGFLTLQFIQFPHTIQFENLKLLKFDWLDLSNLKMELVDFQESALWENKIY